MLENDVSGMGGESVILETVALDRAQEEKVVTRFKADRDEQYREFLGRCADFEKEIAKEIAINKFTYAELEEEDTDLKKLQGWLEKIKKLDFYCATLDGRRERLHAARLFSTVTRNEYSTLMTRIADKGGQDDGTGVAIAS